MMVGTAHYRCSRCGETKPRTGDHFYFDRRGRVTGYCRPCHGAYLRAYWRAGTTEVQRARHNAVARAHYRRTRAVPPERYRGADRAEADA